jgi:glutaredoxin-like protein NrdH
LTRNGIEFETIDLSQDESAMALVKELGYSAAPIVVVGDDHWSGFRMDKISALV